MADEQWMSYATTEGAPACSMAPVADYADAAESATSTGFHRTPSLHDGAALSSSSSFLAADPHVDWTPAYMGGRAAVVATTTSFNEFIQLHSDAGRRFLLDQLPLSVHAQHQYDYNADSTAAPLAAAPETRSSSMYAENQCTGSATRSCSAMRAAAIMMKPFTQQQFSGSSGIFTPAAEPPPILSQSQREGVQEVRSTATRRSSVPESSVAMKKSRVETPFPLPTFKVRKEKFGDRITALQQLVSPFGKTDTASVLHEAIEYIKFLHHQVSSLSSPYLRHGRPVQLPQQQGSSKAKDDEAKEDLRSRGLCLVPLASTYTVANETALEFWHPTFGGSFR